jgi:hypothetical protein
MSDREWRVVVFAFLGFVLLAGGLMVYTVVNDQKRESALVASPLPQDVEPPRVEVSTPEVELPATPATTVATLSEAELELESPQESEPDSKAEELDVDRLAIIAMDEAVVSATDARNACRFFRVAKLRDWPAAPQSEQLAFAYMFATLRHENSSRDFRLAAAVVYTQTVHHLSKETEKENGHDSNENLYELLAFVVGLMPPEALNRDIEAAAKKLEVALRQHRQKDANKVISVHVLKRYEHYENTALDFRVTNLSNEPLEFIRLQIEFLDGQNKYIGVEDELIADLDAQASIIVKCRASNVPWEDFGTAKFAIISDHKSKFYLDVKEPGTK